MAEIRKLAKKYRSQILYIIFGALTTAVNVSVYSFCFSLLGLPNVPSVVIAWILAVLFAFITNKIWVFDSRSFMPDVLKHEIPSFFAARILTGLLDLGIMYLAVDILHWNAAAWKLISNILVILLNYIASRFFIFRGPETSGKEERK